MKSFEKINFEEIEGFKFPRLEWESPVLILRGDTGTGKTWKAKHIMQVNGWAGHEILKADDFWNEFRSMMRSKTQHSNHLENAAGYPRLFIDDFGSEPESDEGGKAHYYGDSWTAVGIFIDILNSRFEAGLRTGITTNLNMDSIKTRYGDKVWRRLMQTATIYHFTGEMWRGEQGKIEREANVPRIGTCAIPLRPEPLEERKVKKFDRPREEFDHLCRGERLTGRQRIVAELSFERLRRAKRGETMADIRKEIEQKVGPPKHGGTLK